MPDKEKFGVDMEEKLKAVREKLDAAKAQAEVKGKDTLERSKEGLKNGLEMLEAKYEQARYQLTLLSNSSGSAWTELRQGFENAYRELKDALSKAKDKF